MKYAVFVSLGLALGLAAGGCPPVTGRLDVNDTLRAACGDYIGSDAGIETFLTLTEDERLKGYTKSDMLARNNDNCGIATTADVYIDCMACSTAVVDQVYGE